MTNIEDLLACKSYQYTEILYEIFNYKSQNGQIYNPIDEKIKIDKANALLNEVQNKRMNINVKGIILLSLSIFFHNCGCEKESNEVKNIALNTIAGNNEMKRTIEQQIYLINFMKEINFVVKHFITEQRIDDDLYHFSKNPLFTFNLLLDEYKKLKNMNMMIKKTGSITNLDIFLKSFSDLLFSSMKSNFQE